MPNDTDDTDDIVSEVRKRYEQAHGHTSRWRQRARDDLEFFHADAYNHGQWDDALYQTRSGTYGGSPRPCLTINKTAQHVFQVENDARQSQMGVKISATGFGAAAETADALEGIVRHIERQSNAQQNAYACAIQGQVRVGLGWVHVTTDYVPGVDTFDQDFFLRSVPDPLCVLADPAAREPDHSDQNWAMIVEEMDRSEFDRLYPGNEDTGRVPLGVMDGEDGWVSDSTVRVATYYRRSEQTDTLWAAPIPQQDGSFGQQPMRESEMPPEMVDLCRQMKAPSRKITSHIVEKHIVGGDRVIASGDTVFSLVPLVPFVGIERRADHLNETDWSGLVRSLIDPQRMYNYSASAFVETVALQSKAPWLAADQAIEGHEQDWARANTANLPYLSYNALDRDTQQPLPIPTRIDPPAGSTGHFQGMQAADQQMQMVTGQYQSEMGAPGNERTGIAIQQRQRQSDTANYHYTDNQGMALRYIGRLLIDAIPRLYDTTRAVQVLGLDGEQSSVIVDPGLPQSGRVALPNDQAPPQGMPLDKQRALHGAIFAINPTRGRFDVEADVGPAFATQRQEAFNALTQIVQAAPQVMAQIGDLIFQSADFPLADEIAERLKPASDNPQAQALGQQLQAAHAQIAQLTQQLKDRQADLSIKAGQVQHDKVLDMMRHDHEQAQLRLDTYRAETDRASALGSELPAAFIPVIQQLVTDMVGKHIAAGGVAPTHPGSTAVPAMDSMNPPGGPIRDGEPSPGDVR